MSWSVRLGVQRWVGSAFPEISDKDLAAYRFCAIPVEERPHSLCGRVGQGRDNHTRLGEDACDLCVTAERLYGSWRRGVIPETAPRFTRQQLQQLAEAVPA